MKTTVNGVEITPAMAEVFSSWYRIDDLNPEAIPEIYARWLSEIQDYLTHILVDICEIENEQIKNYLRWIIFIKDDLKMFIPESSNYRHNKN